MKLRNILLSCAIGASVLVSQSAFSRYFVLNEFVGDDSQMFVNVTETSTGVDLSVGFTPESVNTGDIVGFWIGIDNTLFDPNDISDSQISIDALPGDVAFQIYRDAMTAGWDNDGPINMYGRDSYAMQFYFDIGLGQNTDNDPNDIVNSLGISIDNTDLTPNHFNFFGARLRTLEGPSTYNCCAKLTSVPEPGSLSLLASSILGLFGFAGLRRFI